MLDASKAEGPGASPATVSAAAARRRYPPGPLTVTEPAAPEGRPTTVSWIRPVATEYETAASPEGPGVGPMRRGAGPRPQPREAARSGQLAPEARGGAHRDHREGSVRETLDTDGEAARRR